MHEHLRESWVGLHRHDSQPPGPPACQARSSAEPLARPWAAMCDIRSMARSHEQYTSSHPQNGIEQKKIRDDLADLACGTTSQARHWLATGSFPHRPAPTLLGAGAASDAQAGIPRCDGRVPAGSNESIPVATKRPELSFFLRQHENGITFDQAPQPMRHHTGPAEPQPAAGRMPPLPATVWLPPLDEPHPAPGDEEVLPRWAIEKIRSQIIPRPDDRPSPLLRVHINETADPHCSASLDARARVTSYLQPHPLSDGAQDQSPPLLLAEFHPDTLRTPTTGVPAPLSEPLPDPQDAWPGFFQRAHRLLPPEGILLVATRQQRDDGQLTDPMGELTASARTAGFRYLQHLVITHLHPDAEQHPNPPAEDLAGGLNHSDLLIFSPHATA